MLVDSGGRSAKSVVTGGLGFIGHHLVRALVERGDEVRVIDNEVGLKTLSGDARAARYHKAAKYASFDISDSDNAEHIENACNNADYVFHLAALPRVEFSRDFPVEALKANLVGTAAMLEGAKRAGVKRFIFASSSSVYGDSADLPFREDAPTNPMSNYAWHKEQCEVCCQRYAMYDNLATVCLRIFNAYGPGDDPKNAYALVISKFLEQKRQGVPLTVTGDGWQERDFTHVSDIVRAFMLAAESDKVGGGDIINIGSGKPVSINRLAQLIGGPVKYIDARDEPYRTHALNRLAWQKLGWEPKRSFEDGIAELLRLNHP